MEVENQTEMMDCIVVLSDRQNIAFNEMGAQHDELAWKMSARSPSKEAEEENSLLMYCCKEQYSGNSEHGDSGSTDVIIVCPVVPSLARLASDMSSGDYLDDVDMVLDCQTPRESVFDPFAPGPEFLICAPKKKLFKGSKVPFRKQLHFDLSDDSSDISNADAVDDAAEEDSLFNLIFESFLDLIVSSQLKELSADKLPMQDHGVEGPKTPTSLPLLTGVAETCPPAPFRLPFRSVLCVPEICRTLGFGQP